MKAEIRYIDCTDVYDFETWKPEENECFEILLMGFIGEVGEESGDSFQFDVCSPEWVAKTFGKNEAVLGRHYILQREYNYEIVRSKIEEIVNGVEGRSWRDVGNQIARYGHWEYEDYDEGNVC